MRESPTYRFVRRVLRGETVDEALDDGVEVIDSGRQGVPPAEEEVPKDRNIVKQVLKHVVKAGVLLGTVYAAVQMAAPSVIRAIKSEVGPLSRSRQQCQQPRRNDACDTGVLMWQGLPQCECHTRLTWEGCTRDASANGDARRENDGSGRSISAMTHNKLWALKPSSTPSNMTPTHLQQRTLAAASNVYRVEQVYMMVCYKALLDACSHRHPDYMQSKSRLW